MNHLQTGRIGEDLALRFLLGRGYQLLRRNYRACGAEIDLIMEDSIGSIVFVEVKTVSCENIDRFVPEDMVHSAKIRHISRAARVFLGRLSNSPEFTFAVVALEISHAYRTVRVRFLDNLEIPEDS